MSQNSTNKGKTLFVRGSARSSQQDPNELQHQGLNADAIHKKIQGSAQNISINHDNLHQGHEVIVETDQALKRNQTQLEINENPDQDLKFNPNYSFRSQVGPDGTQKLRRQNVVRSRSPLRSRYGRKVGKRVLEKIEENLDDGEYRHFKLLRDKKKSILKFNVYHHITVYTLLVGAFKLWLFFGGLWLFVVWLMGKADQYLPNLGPTRHLQVIGGPRDHLEYRYDFDIDIDLEYLRWLQFRRFEQEHHREDDRLFDEFQRQYKHSHEQHQQQHHDQHHHPEEHEIELEIQVPDGHGHMKTIEVEVEVEMPHHRGEEIELEIEIPDGHGHTQTIEVEVDVERELEHHPEQARGWGWNWNVRLPWFGRDRDAEIKLPQVEDIIHHEVQEAVQQELRHESHDIHGDVHAEIELHHHQRHQEAQDPVRMKHFYGYCDSEDIRSEEQDLSNCIPCPPNTLCMRGKLHECRAGFTQVGVHCVETLRDGKPFYAEILKLINTIDVGVKTKHHDFIDYGAQNSKIITTKEILNLHHRQYHSSEREVESLKRELYDILLHLEEFGFGLYIRMSHHDLERLDCETCFDTLYLEHKLLNHDTITGSWWSGLLRTRQ